MIKLILLLSLFATTALAQTSVRQSGNVTPGHAAVWTTNGVVQDGGVATNGSLTSIGVTSSGPAICQNTALITAPFFQFCMGTTKTGTGSITLNGYGGAAGASLEFIINGNTYPFPFSGSGMGIMGPNSSVSGHVAAWNNTTGTLLQDPTSILLPDGSVWNTSGLTVNKTFTAGAETIIGGSLLVSTTASINAQLLIKSCPDTACVTPNSYWDLAASTDGKFSLFDVKNSVVPISVIPNSPMVLTLGGVAATLTGGPLSVNTATISGTGMTTSGTVFMSGLATSTSTQTSFMCLSSGGQIVAVAVANTCASSSEKFKEAMFPLDMGLEIVLAMRPISYHYRLTGNPAFDYAPNQRDWQLGFSAEQAAKVDSRLVTVDQEGDVHSFRYEQYVAVLTKAVQELKAEIETLKSVR